MVRPSMIGSGGDCRRSYSCGHHHDAVALSAHGCSDPGIHTSNQNIRIEYEWMFILNVEKVYCYQGEKLNV